MKNYLYSFSAKDIQKYILTSDKLKDMIGGSEIVNAICTSFLERCLTDFGMVGTYEIITQAAGWARIVFHDEQDVRLMMKYWPFLASKYAPGLTIVQCCVPYEEGGLPSAIVESERLMRIERNLPPPMLPEIGPLIERNQRTGLPAVTLDVDGWIDTQICRKRAITTNGLIQKITGNSADTTEWPKDMEKIAGDKHYLAVIHADGNSLGKILIKIQNFLETQPDKAQEIYGKLSCAIEEATINAVKKVHTDVLIPHRNKTKEPYFAARPIVIGGDDLTMIVRDELAFKLTEGYLTAFEQSSQDSFQKHLGCYDITNLPKYLTACAGVAFVKPAFPYSRAYELAESLCHFSKRIAKTQPDSAFVPSCLAFHRISTSIAGDYDEIRKNELTSQNGTVCFWMGPYGVGIHKDKLITLDALDNLARIISKAPSGPLRELITTMYNDYEQAKSDIDRILNTLADSGNIEKKSLSVDLKSALAKLTNEPSNLLTDSKKRTPLLDALRYSELTYQV